MRILILDDDPIRHETLNERYAGNDIVNVDNYYDAVRVLQEQEIFDIASLDHDLNILCRKSLTEDGQELTGADVARYIAKELIEDKTPKQIIIHSWNVPGSVRMRKILGDAGISSTYKPFVAKL